MSNTAQIQPNEPQGINTNDHLIRTLTVQTSCRVTAVEIVLYQFLLVIIDNSNVNHVCIHLHMSPTQVTVFTMLKNCCP